MEAPNPRGRATGRCDECGSGFLRDASAMAGLCPECAHHLYGHPACAHQFVDGRCSRCGWDGSRSAYVRHSTTNPKDLADHNQPEILSADDACPLCGAGMTGRGEYAGIWDGALGQGSGNGYTAQCPGCGADLVGWEYAT